MSTTTESSTRKRTWQRRLETAQKEHRPKLKDWDSDGFGHTSRRRGTFERFRTNSINKGVFNRVTPDDKCSAEKIMARKSVDRISARNLSLEDFIKCYEGPALPCIIADIPEVEEWPAWKKGGEDEWTLENLKVKFADCKFKCGEDDDGYAIKVKLRYFLKYLENSTADSPLYVFDSRFVDNDVAKELLTHFKVPSYFPDDLFGLAGERRRPPYRWFLLGPQRSGTCVHIDPLATSAWNTLIKGRKHWVVWPPWVKKSVAKCWDQEKDGEGDEAINYFIDFLPRLRRQLESKGETVPFFEFIQEPGDTVYIPGGWWHAVLNLDHSIAITQNYCGRQNFEACWRATRGGRKKMAAKWLRIMEESDVSLRGGGKDGYLRDLARMATKWNSEDGFVMACESKKRERRERERREQEELRRQRRRRQNASSPQTPTTTTAWTSTARGVADEDAAPSTGLVNQVGRSDQERNDMHRGGDSDDDSGSDDDSDGSAANHTKSTARELSTMSL